MSEMWWDKALLLALLSSCYDFAEQGGSQSGHAFLYAVLSEWI